MPSTAYPPELHVEGDMGEDFVEVSLIHAANIPSHKSIIASEIRLNNSYVRCCEAQWKLDPDYGQGDNPIDMIIPLANVASIQQLPSRTVEGDA